MWLGLGVGVGCKAGRRRDMVSVNVRQRGPRGRGGTQRAGAYGAPPSSAWQSVATRRDPAPGPSPPAPPATTERERERDNTVSGRRRQHVTVRRKSRGRTDFVLDDDELVDGVGWQRKLLHHARKDIAHHRVGRHEQRQRRCRRQNRSHIHCSTTHTPAWSPALYMSLPGRDISPRVLGAPRMGPSGNLDVRRMRLLCTRCLPSAVACRPPPRLGVSATHAGQGASAADLGTHGSDSAADRGAVCRGAPVVRLLGPPEPL
jgi:hypothetical protein